MKPGQVDKTGHVLFWAITDLENTHARQTGIKPIHRDFLCGICGSTTNGRVACTLTRKTDGAKILWCVCSCNRREQTVIIEKDNAVISQLPIAREFVCGPDWPKDLADLYEEASKAFSAGAFTASGMVCRKILMACACEKGADEGKAFAYYVD